MVIVVISMAVFHGTIPSICGMFYLLSSFFHPLDLQLRAWKTAPALAVGCSIVMKPSENTPLTALVRKFLFTLSEVITWVYAETL